MGHAQAINMKRAVYMLTSFIDAHEHAQRKVHSFIDMHDEYDERGDVDTHMRSGAGAAAAAAEEARMPSLQTPEEARVVAESREAVRMARSKLAKISPETVHAIRAKQASRMLLAKEAEIVKTMVEEGLLTNSHAEDFLEDITHDTQRLEAARNALYKSQAKKHIKERWQQKEEYRESLMSGRPSELRNSEFGNYSSLLGGAGAGNDSGGAREYVGAVNTTPFLSSVVDRDN